MESKIPHSQMAKFSDFKQNNNLLNTNIDLVGIIAKIGELKYANHGSEDKVEILPIRDLQLYDDSFTMVRLILRKDLAENCEHFKVDDIMSLKNVKVMKVQNRFVLTTLQDTIIAVNTAAYEVLWLKQWFLHNKKDIHRNNFTQFNNLSMTPAKPKKEREKDITSSTPSDSPPAKVPRVSSNIVNTLGKTGETSKADLSSFSPSSPMDSKFDRNDSNLSSSISHENNIQKDTVQVISDDGGGEKTNNQKEKNETTGEVRIGKGETDVVKKDKLIIEKIENENDEPDNLKKDVRFETYNTLMHSPFLKNDWDEDKDQYLVNFITKNSYDLQNDKVYDKLLTEIPNVFAQMTPTMLKERVFLLSSVKNYLYLMKLCGGIHLTTEKEKSTFIIKVEKLRESMKLIKTVSKDN